MKKKWNVLDLIFIAVILIAVVAVGIRFTSSKISKATSPVKLEVVVRVDNIRECSVNSIRKSEAFYDKDKLFGKVKNVAVEPFKDHIEKIDGSVVNAENPEKYTVFITMDVDTVQNDHNFFTPNLKTFGVGSSLSLQGKFVAFDSKVQSIKPQN